MRGVRTSVTFACALALAACSADQSLSKEDASALVPAPGALRIDVYPPVSEAGDALLPQSHVVQPDAYAGHILALVDTVEWVGSLSAEQATGWSGAAEVPTQVVPVQATISAVPGGADADWGLLGGSTRSDAESGGFRLRVPDYPGVSWDVAMVPADGAAGPFLRLLGETLSGGRAEDVLLPLGLPVYGRVVDASGAGVAAAPLRLSTRDDAARVDGAPLASDGSGWYVARVAEPGVYAVTVEGGGTQAGGPLVPELTAEAAVDDEEGASVPIALGALDETTIQGVVGGPDGRPVVGATVRAESVVLASGVGRLHRTATTNDDGRFFIDVLAGSYDLTVTAPYVDVLSPTSVAGVDAGADVDIGLLSLGAASFLRGSVADATGRPAVGVVVSAAQDGYDGFVYPGVTDASGSFVLAVPDGAYHVSFSPSSPDVPGAPVTRTLLAGEEAQIALQEGALLDGTVSYRGSPVAQTLVEIYDATTGELVARGLTDEVGRYELRVVLDTGE